MKCTRRDPTGSERACVAQFLDPAVRRHARVGERREFLELETAVHLDDVACWDGDELGESALSLTLSNDTGPWQTAPTTAFRSYVFLMTFLSSGCSGMSTIGAKPPGMKIASY
jgi:hypothetical protein